MRLSISHVLASLHVGGAERVALLLGARQVMQGHTVRVVSFEEPPNGPLAAEFEEAGIPVDRVHKRRGVDLTLTPRLWQLFRRQRPSVVHTHNALPVIYAAPAAKAAGVRVVHTKHGPQPDSAYRLWLRRAGGAATDAFVAVSEATADSARELREVSRRKLTVVINATDLSRFRPDPRTRRATRLDWGVAPDAWVVGTVGRMAEVKNHELLLRSMAPLLGESGHLVIAGDGPERSTVAALAERLGVQPWVHLLGEIREVPAVLQALDVFALSSRVEGLPLVLAEAMATGLPVVATSVGGVPGVVAHGDSGFLVPSEDETALQSALHQLREHPAECVRMGERARELATERFSDERMAREYFELYVSKRGAG